MFSINLLTRQNKVNKDKAKKILRLMLGFLALLGAWFDFSLWLVTSNATSFQLPQSGGADVIIVLGCSAHEPGITSSCQLERTTAAVNLWQAGYARQLIFTGGDTGLGIEAADMAEIALEYGVPREQLTLEEASLNTVQNLRNSQQIMQKHNWQTVILVSEPYHLYRARQQAADQNLKIVGWWPALNSNTWQSFGARSRALVRDTLALMLYQSLGWFFYQF